MARTLSLLLFSPAPRPLCALQARAQLFVFGQAGPFVLCKMRHFFVTWADPYRLVQLAFYSLFTSHLEVAITVAVDTIVAFALLRDWIGNIATDTRCDAPHAWAHYCTRAALRRYHAEPVLIDCLNRLRLNLNKIRCGALTVAPMRRGGVANRSSQHRHLRGAVRRPHAE